LFFFFIFKNHLNHLCPRTWSINNNNRVVSIYPAKSIMKSIYYTFPFNHLLIRYYLKCDNNNVINILKNHIYSRLFVYTYYIISRLSLIIIACKIYVLRWFIGLIIVCFLNICFVTITCYYNCSIDNFTNLKLGIYNTYTRENVYVNNFKLSRLYFI